MIKQCSRCLYTTDHPFGLTFIDDMCSGCFTHEEKNSLDWSHRLDVLKEWVSRSTKTQRQRAYDCVVPVNGDAEDYYVLHHTIHTLNLTPLVVCVNDYFLNDIGWYNLHHLITHFDVDSLTFNPDLTVYQELIRNSLRRSDHMLWPAIALKTAYPVHIAKLRRIPLVIWGQHQAIEQVGKFSHLDSVEMTDWYRQEHDLMDISVEQHIGNGAHLNPAHLNYYQYPDIEQLHKRGVIGIYLSNYLRWDPLSQNQAMVEYGFQPQTQSATYDPYERAGSSVYYQIHDLLKQHRVGYRKVLDHLCRDIRHGYINRDQAIALYDRYKLRNVDVKPFFDWLGMTPSGQQWFIEHRLQGVEHLIGTEHIESSVLPSPLNDKIAQSSNADTLFVPFGKGI